MKPVNLNQLLFQEKKDSLSFFLSPLGKFPEMTQVEVFLEHIRSALTEEGKKNLLQRFDRYHAQMMKIHKSHPEKSHGFFISEDLQGHVILQNDTGRYFVLADTFHIRPLLEELFVNPEFLLVNISLYDIKVFRGDFRHLEIIQHYEFEELPKNFNDFETRFYTPQYMGMIPYKSILATRTIAGKVKDMILYESLPVVVTGLEEMKNIFLLYSSDTTGVITHFHADFYEKSSMEILERCGEFRHLVTDYYSAQLKERLKRMMKSRRILSSLGDIILATYSGKIDHLVIPTEQKIWGKFDSATGEFTIHKKAGKTSIDILNELAEEVIKQGGRIQILGPHFFPRDTNVLAILKG